MNALEWINPATVCVELDPRGLRISQQAKSAAWPLERGEDGRLTTACRERLKTAIPAFLERKPWQPRSPAICGLAGHGVSLRRWKVPRTASADLPRVLRLQIESEFPLGPDELAWGWVTLMESGAFLEVQVAAVRRDAVAEQDELLRECGLAPVFTLGALARQALCPPQAAEHSMLELGAQESEWLAADFAGATRLRVLPWGERNVAEAVARRLGVDGDAAGVLFERWCGGGAELPEGGAEAVKEAAKGLVELLPKAGLGRTVFLSWRLATKPAFVAALSAGLAGGTACESVERNGTVERGAVLRGLQALAARGGSAALLRLEVRPAEPTTLLARPAPRRWAVVAVLLLLALLALPSLEALLLQPGLARRVSAIKANKSRLELIDRETDFLRYLKQNQTAYLDTLFVLGKCAPPGAKIDSFVLNRKGELSLRVSMRQPPEVTDFRTKLVDSGFFGSVVVEEQSPSPDRQKIQVRMSAVLKAPAAREGLAVLSTNAPAGGGGPGGPGMPGMPGMPMGMPGGPGMEMPMGMPPGGVVEMPPGGMVPGGPGGPGAPAGPPAGRSRRVPGAPPGPTP